MFLGFFQKGVERSHWKIVGASRKKLVSVAGIPTSLICGLARIYTSFKILYFSVCFFILASAYFLYKHSRYLNLNYHKVDTDE